MLDPRFTFTAIPKLIGFHQKIGNVTLVEASSKEPPFQGEAPNRIFWSPGALPHPEALALLHRSAGAALSCICEV
jgi:hypothetical protein